MAAYKRIETVSVEHEVGVRAECEDCGNELSATVEMDGETIVVRVEACEYCLNEKEDETRKEVEKEHEGEAQG